MPILHGIGHTVNDFKKHNILKWKIFVNNRKKYKNKNVILKKMV